MNRLRTAVDRSRDTNHEAERGTPARASRRDFVRSEARLHVAELSGVKGVGSAVGSVDTSFGACSVLTRVWRVAQAQVGDGIGSRWQGQDRGSRTWCSRERTSNNRLQATVGGLGVDMPARRAFAHRA